MDKRTVAKRWSEAHATSDAFSADVYWLALPAVQARHQRRGCGGQPYPSWVEYCLAEFLPMRPAKRMLSIGCGLGGLERHLHALRAFESCDAYDIAPSAIDGARNSAKVAGIDSINYRLCDVETFDFGEGEYDAAWFNGSLHHIKTLEPVLKRVRRALTPGGMLFFNEYVGANHFNFPQAQKDAISHAFHLIPEQYRRSFGSGDYGAIVTHPPLPDPAEVRRVDPSEAVRSSDILSTVAAEFDIVAINKAGGTLLQFLLSNIAGNFRADDPASMQTLNMLLAIEDTLIDSGSLPSDFVICAARAKASTLSTAKRAPQHVSTQAPSDLAQLHADNARLLGLIEQLQSDNQWALREIALLRERLAKLGS